MATIAVLYRPSPYVLPSMRRWTIITDDGDSKRFHTKAAAVLWTSEHGIKITEQR